jgi:PAS domain S-box-containing protein
MDDMTSQPMVVPKPRSRAKREAEALMAALVAFSRDAIISCTRDGIIQTWNDGAQRLLGWTPGDVLGRSVLFCVAERDKQRVSEILARAAEGEHAQQEAQVLDREGRSLETSLGVAAVHDRKGEVVALSIIVRDLRRRRRSEANDAMLASVVQQSRDSIFSVTRDGLISTWNPASEQLYGYTQEEAIGRPLSVIVPESRREESRSMFATVMRGEMVLFETLRQRRDGSLVDVSISGAPLRDSHGTIVGISSIHRDITSQRQHEKQMRLVMRELAHRSKNLLAIIISMAAQTARTARTVSDFTSRFTQRLQGIAHSHDLLIQQNWRGAPIRELVRSHLEPFLEGDRNRIHLSGPDVIVDPKAAQNLGLALHELATNASKYGALSSPSGSVSISWTKTNGQFRIAWQEQNGPSVRPPNQRGFGQAVLERLACQALEGTAHLEFEPDGVRWVMEIPGDYLVDIGGERDEWGLRRS